MKKLRRYFLDAEFFQAKSLDSRLISVGLIEENDKGPGFYAISSAFNQKSACRYPWIRDNVIAKLDPNLPRLTPARIAEGILEYIQPAKTLEFWARNGSFDMYQLCQIFAKEEAPSSMSVMMERLKAGGIERVNFRDIEEVRRIAGHPKLPKAPEAGQHIAINDARWDRDQFPQYVAIARARNDAALKAVLGVY